MMKIEEINVWFARKGCKAGQQTHLFTADGTQWKKVHVDDNDESKIALSNTVWEASLIKSPVLCKEILTPTFALFFDIEAKGFQDHKHWGETMKKVHRGVASPGNRPESRNRVLSTFSLNG